VRLGAGPDGGFLPGVLDPVTRRQGKVDALHLAHHRDPTLMLGDSQGDLPLLRAARFRLVIDKGDERVRSEARAGGWWITEGARLS
jgi:phosphoserine phosphatase